MEIVEKDFKLIPLDGNFFNLEFLYTVNKGKENEKQEFRNAAYGISLESAIKRIVTHRILDKRQEETVTLAQYLKDYKECIEEIKKLCEG